MTTRVESPRSALLVIDVQKGVVGGTYNRDSMVANIASLVARARAAGVPVVWVQHSDTEGLEVGSPAWEYVEELHMTPGEPLVHKVHPDSFEGTELEEVLTVRGVGELVVVGAQSDQCVRSTIHGAFTRGYDVTLLSDAHTTEDLTEWGAPAPELVVAHTNMYWSWMSAPGRTAAVKATAEIDFT